MFMRRNISNQGQGQGQGDESRAGERYVFFRYKKTPQLRRFMRNNFWNYFLGVIPHL